ADEISRRIAEAADVFVFSKQEEGMRETETIGRVTHIRPAAKTAARYRVRVLEQLGRIRPELVQVENRPKRERMVKRAVPGAEVWLTLHSLTFTSPRHISGKRLRRVLRAADRFVLNSRLLRRELTRRFPRFKSKMLVYHLGINPVRFRSRCEEGVR